MHKTRACQRTMQAMSPENELKKRERRLSGITFLIGCGNLITAALHHAILSSEAFLVRRTLITISPQMLNSAMTM